MGAGPERSRRLARHAAEGHDWIARADGPFKDALDRTKYATRYPEADPEQRAKAATFLHDLDAQLGLDL